MPESGSRRGRAHDAEGAREAILDAAEKVFAEHGFDGARVDAIAAEAGYNKSLIFQYFDDKLGLYAAVIRRADDQMREWQNATFEVLRGLDTTSASDQLQSVVRHYIGYYFDYLVEHPTIRRIFNWEMAEGWQTFIKILSQRDFEDVDQLALIFPKLQEAGLLRSNFNPLPQVSTGLYLCGVYLSLIPLFNALIPSTDFSSSEDLRDAREFIIEFILNGLLVRTSK